MASLEAAIAAYKAGDLQAALTTAQAVAARPSPQRSMAHALAGNILVKLGDKKAAAKAFEQAARIKAFEQAARIKAFETAADANPSEAATFLKLAATLFSQAGEMDEVRRIGLEAALLNRADTAFVFTMAQALIAPWDTAARAAVAQLIPHLDRSSGPAMVFAAGALRANWQLAALKALLDECRQSLPEDINLESLRFHAAHDMVDLDTIARHQMLMRQPDNPYASALLAHEPALVRLLWCEDEALQARPVREHLALAESYAARPPRRHLSPEGERLHIGYLSSDFHAHATMTLFLDSLVAHDRDRFRISLLCHTAEAYLADQQALPAVLRGELVGLRGLSDAEAAAEIDRRGVDILVDLKGHTPGARLGIVNLSSAPIKATYLGFPGPVSGVDLDYVLSDRIVTPDSAADFYTEKFCRLPDSYQANSAASRPQPKPARRSDHGLPDDAFVFASFNGVQKITPQTLALWLRVLKAVPDSLIWILCPDPFARDNLRASLIDGGVEPARVIFAGRMDYGDHVHRLPLADLALDTFPYNGHTTTSDMLWTGLPVLTKRGNCFAARVSQSLLTAVGLPELVAEDDADFVRLAAELAGDPARVAALKNHLIAARATAPLFDSTRFTRHLERACEAMAARARAGLAPDHIDVDAIGAG